ncbi:MAG: polysaccharide deacetylase [Sphingobium sp.]|nr:polysaccharide deacetylase [Sphingobium sp.]
MDQPVFFDPTGARRRWTSRGFWSVIALAALAAGVFILTLVSVPSGGELPLAFERAQPAPLARQISGLRHRLGSWLPRGKPAVGGKPVTMAFYVPWDPSSAESLSRNIGAIDILAPVTLFVNGPTHALNATQDAPLARILAGAPRRPAVMPLVQNAQNGQWDGAGAAALFASKPARAKFLAALKAEVTSHRWAGIVFDFELLPPSAVADYRALIGEANAAFDKIGASVFVAVPVGNPAWSPGAFATVADKIILMNYDFHSEGGDPGPIAPQGWYVDNLRAALAEVTPDRMIVAVGSYGYDWYGDVADPMTIEEAWLAAHDSDARVVFDPVSGNSGFGYEEGGVRHQVWMLDAAAMWNELKALRASGLGSIALWRLGSEDPGVWPAIQAFRRGTLPDLRRIDEISNADVESSGEILRITTTPRSGARTLRFDAQGLIRDVHYDVLPTPYVVKRIGAIPKLVALTFDDGPDPTWTAPILDVLKREKVPATFFVIGENALANPLLLQRMVNEGHELGNHTYTHPNLALASAPITKLELNLTQRLLEAYTGRSTRLFRAPYFGDAEPTTADELLPALVAQEQGYTVVGLHADPGDWKRPGAQAIADQTVASVVSATPEVSRNIVLLHDGGGDRAETVAALPQLIERLRARGYRFVPVSTLAGLNREAVMPTIKGSDLAAVRADIGIFLLLAGIQWLFGWMFALAIALGIARAVIIAGVALLRRRRATPPEASYQPPVSVIIPAFNEARVIEASVRRVLASDYPDLQVIVVDDGSTDGTSDIVTAAFGDEPQVTLLTLRNGGKAAALNRALTLATAEIVIALDADTQFEPGTIDRLARWFADPKIGAVAGNAKVGNRVNLVTRWQAVEYVTAQNLERRALSRFDAITVVPGAVGAWRRAALDSVGGYPVDTLAEDQDLTIAIQRAGWQVTYDTEAVAWTEAPQSFRALAKQRYRWAFGTLQCLWKHRGVMASGRPRGLALIGMPQAWLFQILFAAISPFIDLALVVSIVATANRVAQHGWAQTQTDVVKMALYWLIFTTIDIAAGAIAYRLDGREPRYPVLRLVAQRFVYRQLMYWVVLRAISAAIGGWWVGWGKLERTGTVTGNAS